MADEHPRDNHLCLRHLALQVGTTSVLPEHVGTAVILGSSLSRALTGNAPLLSTLVATGLVVVLYVEVTAIAPHTQVASRRVKGHPIPLVRDGKADFQASRWAHFGENDLLELLRLNGLRERSKVEDAHLERNGQVNVSARGGS